jgi:hypothetical protein
MANYCHYLVGLFYNDWEVLSHADVKHGSHFWNCRCKCGSIREISGGDLMIGHTKKCRECFLKEINMDARRKKGKIKRKNTINTKRALAILREGWDIE